MRTLMVSVIAALLSVAATAEDYEYKVFFGLSKPGGGTVTVLEWRAYEADFARQFPGFNVAETAGFYLSEKESSRIITLYMDECRESQLRAAVRTYVTQFGQDSVLVAKTPVTRWELVEKASVTVMDDVCEAAPNGEDK